MHLPAPCHLLRTPVARPTRALLAAGAIASALAFAGGAQAQSATPSNSPTSGAASCGPATQTMRGGSNNYQPNAPMVPNLGQGFVVSGRVVSAATCQPLPNVRIQIWAATERGNERVASNHASVRTGADGRYRLEMSQILPQFGQAHAHLAYDDGEYETVFLRPLLERRDQTSLEVNFTLAPKATPGENPG